jgi:hypothetical protein
VGIFVEAGNRMYFNDITGCGKNVIIVGFTGCGKTPSMKGTGFSPYVDRTESLGL